jgi:hypothetical protein
MSSMTPALEHKNPADVSAVGLKVFFNITREWGLSSREERNLLGDPGRSTFYKWRDAGGPTIPRDTLERISYVMGVYKALRILFPTLEQANQWPKKENSHFGGETALEVMLKGSVMNLADVRRYLDGMRG